MFDQFCKLAEVSKKKKFDAVVDILWFDQHTTKVHGVSIKKINEYLDTAGMGLFNVTTLAKNLRTSRKTTKNSAGDYRLKRETIEALDKIYVPLLKVDFVEAANISATPFLQPDDIAAAMKMASLYPVIHCFENSVRKLIEAVLYKKHGDNWWNKVKNNELDQKVTSRKNSEKKNQWLKPRGATSSLYYVDWGDLVKIIKKEEALFEPYIGSMDFITNRLGDTEKIRNILAHNGTLPDDREFDRVKNHFIDWCTQMEGKSI